MRTTVLIKIIPNFPDYEISQDGLVYSIRSDIFLKSVLNKGYSFVKLWKNKKPYLKFIHRLLLETFIGPCPNDMEGCHNNGNPSDNRLENLRWGTRSDNIKDAIKHGTWIDKPSAKLNELQVRIIRRLLGFGTLKQREIAEIFGVAKTAISRIKTGKTWNKNLAIL
jgi:hypothetical protein